ncbi:RICIN domain-containing protein [uncultured Actinomyces sp.]|uniref:RICIN domain-containing protein n=1 Tax=uncultured Actinomyces sp. TaxID=249061 RepID=UPI0037DC8455
MKSWGFNSRSHCQLEWKRLPDGQFQNVQTGKCLAVREDSSENGTVLHIWDCHPRQTEKWSFGR